MTYEHQEQIAQWMQELEDADKNYDLYSLDKSPKKFHESVDISALLFLYSKMKQEQKPKHSLMHGEHDTVYLGYFDWFEDFTKEDCIILKCHGIFLCDEGDGFQMWASL